MGAFGAALIARERYNLHPKETSMLSLDRIIGLTYTTTMSRCRGCVNHCVLTINRFEGGRQYISGNRCERGAGGFLQCVALCTAGPQSQTGYPESLYL